MDIINMFLQTPLLQITAAICGSVVGSLALDPVKRYGVRISILYTIIAMVFSSGISEYLAVGEGMLFVTAHVGIGVGIGLTCQYLVEEVKESAPKFFKMLSGVLTSTVVDSIADTVTMFFDGIKRIINRMFPK